MQSEYQIECQAQVQYIAAQSQPEQGQWVFAYTIRIVNTGSVAAQLISRHWVIENANGEQQNVRGLGVVGKQPLLQPGEGFEYTSGTQLSTQSGVMRGCYFFVAEDGTRFEAQIAPFQLSADEPQQRTLH